MARFWKVKENNIEERPKMKYQDAMSRVKDKIERSYC